MVLVLGPPSDQNLNSEVHSDRIDSANIREFTGDRPIRSTTGGVVNFVNTQP